MRYFGPKFPSEKYPAPIFEHAEKVDTPVGVPCLSCGKPIEDGETGFVFPHIGEDGTTEEPRHRHCMLANVLGEDMAVQVEKEALEQWGDQR